MVGADFQASQETSQGSRKFSKTAGSVEQLDLCVWVRLQELFIIRKNSIKIVLISMLYHICRESDIKVREQHYSAIHCMNECDNIYEENLWNELDKLACRSVCAESELVTRCQCGSDSYHTTDGGERSCAKCFMVVCKKLDSQPEWKSFCDGTQTDTTRCGLPINQYAPVSGMGTIIGSHSLFDAKKSKHFFEYTQLAKFHFWNSMPYRERSLNNILSNINFKAGHKGINQIVIEDAKALYAKISKDRITRGNNREGLIASSIYMSCKTNKVPRSAKEIAKIFDLDITTMTRGCKHFNDLMYDNANIECTKPGDFLRRYLSNLSKMSLFLDCKYVLTKATAYSLVNEYAPPSIAAGVIFLVAKHKNEAALSKKYIASACEVSDVTINKIYKKLDKFREHIILQT